MILDLTDLQAKELDKLIATALRALPDMIKQNKNLEAKKEMRTHRDALILIRSKIKL